MKTNLLKTRWAAIGAAVAVTLGAGGLGISYATNPAGATAFVPITPCRVVDTRPAPDNVGARTSPLGPNETFTVSAHGNNGNCAGIPTGATGVSLNVTALDATTSTFLTLWAAGAAQPTASNLNPQPGQPPTPNAVTTGLSAGGQFSIFNKVGSVNVIVDIVGYYTDHNHDDRYLPVMTVLSYVGANTEASPTLDDYELIRVVGDVTKQHAATVLQLDWNAHQQYIGTDNSDFCHYQLRIDGRANDGSNSTGFNSGQEGNAISYSSNSPLTSSALFQGLSAGNHTVQVWVRGSATSCILNRGNFNQNVTVTEFQPAAGSMLG